MLGSMTLYAIGSVSRGLHNFVYLFMYFILQSFIYCLIMTMDMPSLHVDLSFLDHIINYECKIIVGLTFIKSIDLLIATYG